MLDMRSVIWIGGVWGVIVHASDLTADDGLNVSEAERRVLLDADPDQPYMITAAFIRQDDPDAIDTRLPPFVTRAATFLDAQAGFMYVLNEMVRQAQLVLDEAFGLGVG